MRVRRINTVSPFITDVSKTCNKVYYGNKNLKMKMLWKLDDMPKASKIL